MDKRTTGFTLIELMIVVAIIAIIAAIAIPGLIRARIASNETSAVGCLKTICTAQSQFKTAALVDQDGDGNGEYGYLQELSGTVPYRTAAGFSSMPANPAFLTSVLGDTAMRNGGVGSKSGYSFLIYLPTAAGPAVAESVPLPTFMQEDADPQEVRFVCYAVPSSLGNSGNRAMVVNQGCEIFCTANKGNQDYGGTDPMTGNFPLAGAAYVATPPANPHNLEGSFVVGTPATDTYLWGPCGN